MIPYSHKLLVKKLRESEHNKKSDNLQFKAYSDFLRGEFEKSLEAYRNLENGSGILANLVALSEESKIEKYLEKLSSTSEFKSEKELNDSEKRDKNIYKFLLWNNGQVINEYKKMSSNALLTKPILLFQTANLCINNKHMEFAHTIFTDLILKKDCYPESQITARAMLIHIIMMHNADRNFKQNKSNNFKNPEFSDLAMELGQLILSSKSKGISLNVMNIFLVAMYKCFGPEIVKNFLIHEIGRDLGYFLEEEVNKKKSIEMFKMNMHLILGPSDITDFNDQASHNELSPLMKMSLNDNDYPTLNTALKLIQIGDTKCAWIYAKHLIDKFKNKKLETLSMQAKIAFALTIWHIKGDKDDLSHFGDTLLELLQFDNSEKDSTIITLPIIAKALQMLLINNYQESLLLLNSLSRDKKGVDEVTYLRAQILTSLNKDEEAYETFNKIKDRKICHGSNFNKWKFKLLLRMGHFEEILEQCNLLAKLLKAKKISAALFQDSLNYLVRILMQDKKIFEALKVNLILYKCLKSNLNEQALLFSVMMYFFSNLDSNELTICTHPLEPNKEKLRNHEALNLLKHSNSQNCLRIFCYLTRIIKRESKVNEIC